MKTLTNTIAAAIAFTVVAVGSASASVTQDGKELVSNIDFEQNKELVNTEVLGNETHEGDVVADELRLRLNIK